MTILHHPSQALLMAHATGQLPEAFDLAIAVHVSLCDACRAEVMALEVAGGAVLDEMAPVPLTLDAAALDRITALPAAPAPARKAAGTLPAPLAEYLGSGLADVRWRPVGMGVKQAVVRTREGRAKARLLYIPPGQALPDHGHNGLELTLVLQGAFRDADRRFARGDIEVADAGLEHRPVADAGEPCICLAVTDARLRFRALLPRLAQRFTGI